MALTRDSCLFYVDFRRGVRPTVGGEPAYLRDAGAYFLGRLGRYSLLPVDTPQMDWVEVDGEWCQALLLEPAGAGLLTSPADVSAAPWSAHPSLTPSAASSCIAGQTARRLTSDGTLANPYVYQAAGVFTGAPETVSLIIERGNYALAHVGVYDTTASAMLGLTTLDMDTGTLSGAGASSATARLLSTCGPNGGALWEMRVGFTGTAGNGRRPTLFPVGDGGQTAGRYGIIHYCGLEATAYGTSPLVGGSRALGRISWSGGPRPQGLARYTRYVAGTTNGGGLGNARLAVLGGSGVASPIWGTYENAGQLWVWANNGAAQSAAVLAIQRPYGSLVEVVDVLHDNGVVRLFARVDGSAVLTSVGDVPAGGLPSEWAPGGPRVALGAYAGGANPSRNWFLRHAIVRLADMDAQPGVAEAADVMDEFAQFDLDPAGNLI